MNDATRNTLNALESITEKRVVAINMENEVNTHFIVLCSGVKNLVFDSAALDEINLKATPLRQNFGNGPYSNPDLLPNAMPGQHWVDAVVEELERWRKVREERGL